MCRAYLDVEHSQAARCLGRRPMHALANLDYATAVTMDFYSTLNTLQTCVESHATLVRLTLILRLCIMLSDFDYDRSPRSTSLVQLVACGARTHSATPAQTSMIYCRPAVNADFFVSCRAKNCRACAGALHSIFRRVASGPDSPTTSESGAVLRR